MRTQPLVDITLFGYLQEREIKPVENRFRQGIAQEIPGIPHLGKRQMEERVMGLVGLFHTRYNGEIEPLIQRIGRKRSCGVDCSDPAGLSSTLSLSEYLSQ
jgi:hypothetical protein